MPRTRQTCLSASPADVTTRRSGQYARGGEYFEARASKTLPPPRAHYPDRCVVTSAGLALRRVWRVRSID